MIRPGIRIQLSAVLLMAAAAVPAAFAQDARQAEPSSVRIDNARWPVGAAAPAARYRMQQDLQGQEPAQALARDFGWQPDDLQLISRTERQESRHLLYRQTWQGIPVWNRFVRINLDGSERATLVVNGFRALESEPPARAAVNAAVARSIAAQDGSMTSTPELVVVDMEPARLAWHLMVWPRQENSEFEVLVDAISGDVLHRQDMTVRRRGAHAGHDSATGPLVPHVPVVHGQAFVADQHARHASRIDGTGTVFDPDPLATSGADYGPPFVDNDDATNASIDGEMVTVTLRDITRGGDGLYRLEGPYVRIVGENSGGVEVYTPPVEAAPTFAYNRSEPGFEATSVYYHIHENQLYLQELGFPDIQNASPLPVNPQGTAADDSGWLASRRFLFFGTGGVDDGEDVAVVLHEYGHAIIEGVSPGLRSGLEGRALHEGWADYWAMSYQRGMMDNGLLARDDWENVFRWDSGLGSIWAGRVLDFSGRYPDDTCSDDGFAGGCSVHNDGRLWATVMMEVYGDVGRTVTDRLSILALPYLAPGVTFGDAAEAVIQADIDHYGGQHVEQLIARFAPRGLVDASSFGPLINHDPLERTEQVGGVRQIDLTARGIGADVTSVSVMWRHGSGAFNETMLSPGVDFVWSGSIPLPATPGEVSYFIRARDAESRESLRPREAPSTVYAFETGPDTQAPQLVHTPLSDMSLAQWPPDITAVITDELGVQSAVIDWEITIPGEGTRTGSSAMEDFEGEWLGGFGVEASEIGVGTMVTYRITATDISQAENQSVSGPHSFEVTGSGVLRSFEPGADTVTMTGLFAVGAPRIGTLTGRTGATVWGTDPAAPYPASAGVSTLEFPEMNLRGSHQPLLVFWHWFDTEHDGRADPAVMGPDVLWDGGNVKVSVDGGNNWQPLDPVSGYTGTLIAGPDNPLAGQPAFGGFSHAWRRAVMPLPALPNVRVRFDFGTDASNSEQAVDFAGWYIDDVVVTNSLETGPDLPELLTELPATQTAPAGAALPAVTIEVQDEIGVSDAWLDYTHQTGNETRIYSQRMVQAPVDLSEFTGAMPLASAPIAGDVISWRVRLRDVDGNEAEYPSAGAPPNIINVRLALRSDLTESAVASGGWRRSQSGVWNYSGSESGALVFSPITIAVNQIDSSFRLEHEYSLSPGSPGVIEVSRDGGSSWAMAEPVGGYPGADAWISSASRRVDVLDLSLMAGEIIQLRLRVLTPENLTGSEPVGGSGNAWLVYAAEVVQETVDEVFELPGETVLNANFPDPFNGSTTLSFSIPTAGPVRLTAHDMLGRHIATLVDDTRDAGSHSVMLDASTWASGVYLVRLDTGTEVKFELITLAR
ncbi:MAG: M36 family metallopeptidase [Rhodothermales bacterium]|nr:M36 family metallopeptidase [Rhodothermales bacterium]MBO6779139.1 M36 family metallopeptidase [Rhodothermales bacterium]